MTNLKFSYLILIFTGMLGLTACEDMPPDEVDSLDLVTVSALLEPGDTGIQKIYLTHTIALEDCVSLAAVHVPDADIFVQNHSQGELLRALENPDEYCYEFNRADLPLHPGDRVEVSIGGVWGSHSFLGSASTTIVNDEQFDWIRIPPQDTVMWFDQTLEENFTDVIAFEFQWEHLEDSLEYVYQTRLTAVVYDSLQGEWVQTPSERLYELRWYPGEGNGDPNYSAIIRDVPGPWVERPKQLSWYFFTHVDSLDYFLDDEQNERHVGWYHVDVIRMNRELVNYFFSIHPWVRAFPYDPVEFNLEGENCQGVVGSQTILRRRVKIIDDVYDPPAGY